MRNRMMLRVTRLIKLLGICICLLAMCASSSWELKPWVKPYQRGRLADPIMAMSRDPASMQYMMHVYEAREASRGAEGGSGGGCGCN